MSPEAQRIAIAKECGLTETKYRFWYHGHDNARPYRDRLPSREVAEQMRQSYLRFGRGCGEVEEYTDFSEIPDYLNDRNAMAGALSTRKGDLAFWSAYELYLCSITSAWTSKGWGMPKKGWGMPQDKNPELLLNPTAADQAQAFLRALNLFTL